MSPLLSVSELSSSGGCGFQEPLLAHAASVACSNLSHEAGMPSQACYQFGGKL